jgi:predicted transglutaminase-like cysteine proteinase
MLILSCGRLLATLAALSLAVAMPPSMDQSRADSRDGLAYPRPLSPNIIAAPVALSPGAQTPHQSDEFGAQDTPRGQMQESGFEQTALPLYLTLLETTATSPTMAPLQPSEPFGLKLSALVDGGIQNKWRRVERELPREHAILVHCRERAATCPPAATRFLAVLDRAQAREGGARIAEINRTVNLDIKPVDDMTQYGVEDLWATPLMTFKSNSGDCEDYAIAKYFALHELGIALGDLRLIIARDSTTHQDHAVTAVRYDGRWNILDNRTLDIRVDTNLGDLNPRFSIDSDGAKYVVNNPDRGLIAYDASDTTSTPGLHHL